MITLAVLALGLAAVPTIPPFPGNGHRCEGSPFATGDILPVPGTRQQDSDAFVVQISALHDERRNAVGWIYVLNTGKRLVQFTPKMPQSGARALHVKVPASGYSGVTLLPASVRWRDVTSSTCRFASVSKPSAVEPR